MNKSPNELATDFLVLTIIPRLQTLPPRQRWLTVDRLIELLAEYSKEHGESDDRE